MSALRNFQNNWLNGFAVLRILIQLQMRKPVKKIYKIINQGGLGTQVTPNANNQNVPPGWWPLLSLPQTYFGCS